MSNYVVDTMAVVLYLENRKLPAKIKTILNQARAAENEIKVHISVVSLMEIGYLAEKKRIDVTIDSVLDFVKNTPNFQIRDLDPEIVSEAFQIKDVPELHDRLITATAAVLEAVLITNDPVIQASGKIRAVW